MDFPEHKGGLYITHQPHLANYETPEEWAEDNDRRGYSDWVSDEQRDLAMTTGQIWVVQWYPNTPVGFTALCGADLESVLTAAKETK